MHQRFKKSQYDFEQLLEEAFKNKEIIDGIESADITQNYIETRIMSETEEIWNAGAVEIEEVNDLENTLALKNEELNTLAPSPKQNPQRGSNPDRNIFDILFLTFASIVVSLIIAYVASGFFIGWGTAFTWLVIHLGLALTLIAIIVVIALTILTYFLGRAIDKRRENLANLAEEIENKRYQEETEIYNQKKIELGIDALKNRITKAEKESLSSLVWCAL